MKFILKLLFLLVISINVYGQEECNGEYSKADLSRVKGDIFDLNISELRGDGIYYQLTIEVTKSQLRGSRTPKNTILILSYVRANPDTYSQLEDFTSLLVQRKIDTLCLKVSPESYNRDLQIPKKFMLNYELVTVFELDLSRPFPR